MMALESISTSETIIQSSIDNDDDLEDGEIPSDEDDESLPVVPDTVKPVTAAAPAPATPSAASETTSAADTADAAADEPPKSQNTTKTEAPKSKGFDSEKSGKSKKSGNVDKSNKQKVSSSDDWAGDVEKAIRAALDEDRSKNHDSKSGRSKGNKNKNRKRNRDEKEDERIRDQKKKKLSDEEIVNEDDDDLVFVRGASPSRRGSHDDCSPRRSERDNYNSGSDFDDRPNRHRDDNKRVGKWSQSKAERNNKKAPIQSNRRNPKNDRIERGKNRTRAQLRNERNNGRRNQINDFQDPESICVYYMQGKCHRGDDCPFSHNALPPRKMELCKFYLMDCCAKRDKCLYMHHDFPCKFFHTGLKCGLGENCKFSHEPMNEQVKNILLKHLETAPKEILGNFPRLSREGALYLINNTERNSSHSHDGSNQKIPSLFEVKVATMNEGRDDDDRDRGYKDRKGSSGKKTRWGSNDDRVPIDMLVQSASQLSFIGNQDKPQKAPSANFYNEANDINLDVKRVKEKNDPSASIASLTKDVDLRQLMGGVAKKPLVIDLADEAASFTKSKIDEESDRDEDGNLVSEVPAYEEKKLKVPADKTKNSDLPATDVPTSLPKKTQELYMRIQQQQREAEDSFKNLENTENLEISQDDWYSDDNDDDDDDEQQLTIVLKDNQKDEEEEEEKKEEPMEVDTTPQPLSIPQPAAIVDKLGNLSKIDISMEVSKLLSTIKAQSSSNHKHDKELALKSKRESEASSVEEVSKPTTAENSPLHQTGNNSPTQSSISSTTAQSGSVSRDPRMSRDPRQRREDPRTGATSSTVPVATKPAPELKESRSLRLETSIYSSGIIAQDATLDTDLRAKLDQDHRRKDMDLRCFPPGPSFGDTDLRLVGGHYPESAKSGDVDLRQMLGLPFKPVPSHMPCTEIEAGLNSHPSIPYKVYVVDVPRPDYTGLKLTKNDPQVKYDPRLRKIFRLSKDDIVDSPMSPPPIKMLDTPKSPPLVRTDPRRKALEVHAPKIIPTTVQQHPVQEHLNLPGMGLSMGQNIQAPFVQGQSNMQMHGMQQGMNQGMQQSMGQSMMMPGNSMMGPSGMGPMMRDGPNMSGNGGPGTMGGSSMRIGGMGQGGPQMSGQGQYYSGQRTGLLGAGPGPLPNYSQDVRNQYDMPGRGYPTDNYNNYGPNGPNSDRVDHRFNSNGPMDEPGFGGSADWNSNPSKIGRKDRRRPPRGGKFSGMPRRKDLT
ncbi:uncharacterized protein LOC106643214 isoform X3 [Copidosoma floridanum]|uniref:uncharacterized protein LOC106643214 isoform X3 n=1 Tax=Copidosoma floridanum TaxID=29053 RepID=UPI000C6F7FD5|nr:uncharacterized protein LOC106643214 isoform X3 [Copidosoma floridanum]